MFAAGGSFCAAKVEIALDFGIIMSKRFVPGGIMKEKGRIFQSVVTAVMFGFWLFLLCLFFRFNSAGTAPISLTFNVSVGLVTLLGYAVLSLIQILDTASKEKSTRLFWSLIVMGYLGIFFDNFSWCLDGQPALRYLNFLLSLGSYLTMPLLLVVYWNYQNHIFSGESNVRSVTKIPIYLFAVLDIVYILISTATGYLFRVDEYGVFTDGNGFIFVLIYPVFSVFCCIFENLRHKLPAAKMLSLISFGVLPIFTIAFLMPLQSYSYLYVAVFLDLILIYGTVQSKRGVELARKSAELAEQNQKLLEQKTQIMISQIQPHFLYNTLTAIYQLCDLEPQTAKRMILSFSSYLRANMDSIKSTAPIPFEKELAHTKTYLEIELVRFGDILNVEYDIAVTDFEIPALTLQPLVENAVKHGIRSREDGGTVTISTRREDGTVYVSVRDDGMGFDTSAQKQDGRSYVGIDNTRSRLQLLANAELIIESEIGVGTTATIVLENQV